MPTLLRRLLRGSSYGQRATSMAWRSPCSLHACPKLRGSQVDPATQGSRLDKKKNVVPGECRASSTVILFLPGVLTNDSPLLDLTGLRAV